MGMKKIGFVLAIVLGALAPLRGQEAASEWSNFGLKMGMGAYSFFGGELKNPTPLLGYVTGVYYQTPTDKGMVHFQTGLDVRFRGGNFNNAREQDTAINTAYTKISLVSLDLPVQCLISLEPRKKQEAMFLALGVQASYLFRSVMYLGPNKLPMNRSVYLQQWDKLPLEPIDFQAHIGIQQRGPVVGYSVMLNASVRSLNKNNAFEVNGINPTTGNGLFIGTWSIEAALIF
jgi:hypothetical protein